MRVGTMRWRVKTSQLCCGIASPLRSHPDTRALGPFWITQRHFWGLLNGHNYVYDDDTLSKILTPAERWLPAMPHA